MSGVNITIEDIFRKNENVIKRDKDIAG